MITLSKRDLQLLISVLTLEALMKIKSTSNSHSIGELSEEETHFYMIPMKKKLKLSGED